MSTVQKAFTLIVLVLAVLTAAAQLALFAQRQDWKGKYETASSDASKYKKQFNDKTRELKTAKDDASNTASSLNVQLKAAESELSNLNNKLDAALADKSIIEELATRANVKLDGISQNLEALEARNEQILLAKEAVDEELAVVRDAALNAKEQLTVVSRRAEDLSEKTIALEEQLARRGAEVAGLRQKVEVLKQYAPDLGPAVPVVSGTVVHGKVTSIDRDTVYLSVGSDDGVKKGMLLLIYKADGTYAADAKVRRVDADKSAARVIQPVRAAIEEGDNVATK